MAETMPIIKAVDLKVWYPVRRTFIDALMMKPRLYVHAVDGVTFDIHASETLCLVGESGCGKTTTGRALLRLVDVENIRGGKVLFQPYKSTLDIIAEEQPEAIDEETKMVNIYKLNEKLMKLLRREMQIVFQDPFGSLNPRFKVYDIVEEPLKIHGIGTPEERYDMVWKALSVVKLNPPEEFMERYPHQLSGGQRQRVSIARALVLNPRFLMADEPVSMLDVSIRAEVLEVLNELKEKFNMAILFITHDLALARYVCDRIAVMYLGRIVELAPADVIVNNPLHPYTKALIAAIPEPNPENRLKMREIMIKGEVTSAVNIPPGCRFRPRCIAYDNTEWVRPHCESSEPGLIEVEPNHYVACWLYKSEASKTPG